MEEQKDLKPHLILSPSAASLKPPTLPGPSTPVSSTPTQQDVLGLGLGLGDRQASSASLNTAPLPLSRPGLGSPSKEHLGGGPEGEWGRHFKATFLLCASKIPFK